MWIFTRCKDRACIDLYCFPYVPKEDKLKDVTSWFFIPLYSNMLSISCMYHKVYSQPTTHSFCHIILKHSF